MSLNKVIAELSQLTFEERQILTSKALELDNPPLTADDEALVEARLADHRADPASSLPLADFKARLRFRSKT